MGCKFRCCTGTRPLSTSHTRSYMWHGSNGPHPGDVKFTVGMNTLSFNGSLENYLNSRRDYVHTNLDADIVKAFGKKHVSYDKEIKIFNNFSKTWHD